MLAAHTPSRAHREIAELGRLIGGVPALHDALEALRPLVLAIALEPFGFHQAAAQRSRRLLILSGEVVWTDGPPDVLEGFERLTVGVQSLAPTARETSRSPDRLDPVHLVGFSETLLPS